MSKQLKQMTQANNETLTPHVDTKFEQLQPLMDKKLPQETKTNNDKNNVRNDGNNNNDTDNETKEEITTQKLTGTKASNMTFVSTCEIDIESIQNHMQMLNNQIETKLESNERSSLFYQLFHDVCPKGIRNGNNNSYLIANWIIKLIRNSFFNDIDINTHITGNVNGNNKKSRFFGISNEMNLQCSKYILDHRNELENVIDSITEKGRNSDEKTNIKILENYLAKYNHKCQKNDCFIGSDQIDTVEHKLIDILRNILIQIQIVHRIFNVIERMCNNTARKQFYEFGCGKKIEQKYWIPMTIERYLSLGLLDLSLMVNGITLYHLLIFQEKENLLKILLHRVAGDWSVLKDNSGRV